MPFTIGKVFSDEALSLLQRRQEADRQAALEQQRLMLQQMGMQSDAGRGNRELNLRAAALEGDAADRELRRELAQADNRRADRNLDLSAREQGFREEQGRAGLSLDREKFGEGVRQFGIESGQKERRQSFEEDESGRRLDLGERAQEEDERTGAFNRETKFPTEVGLKAMEIERKGSADDDRARKIDAEIDSLRARTNLTTEQAKVIQEKNGWSSYDRVTKELGTLTRAYDAAANGINGPNEPLKEEIEGKIKSLLAVLSTADEGMYRTLLRQLGPQLSSSMGDRFSPFSSSGYGASGDIYERALQGFGKGNAPPKGK